MAHALMLGIRAGLNAMKTSDVGKVVLVLITDGRANVPLDMSENPALVESHHVQLSLEQRLKHRNACRDEVPTLCWLCEYTQVYVSQYLLLGCRDCKTTRRTIGIQIARH
jgi:hypothetical protein